MSTGRNISRFLIAATVVMVLPTPPPLKRKISPAL